MKSAVVFLRGVRTGVLTEDENGYTFSYDADYIASDKAESVSLTLPLSDKPYHDKVLFPFFDGLNAVNATISIITSKTVPAISLIPPATESASKSPNFISKQIAMIAINPNKPA